MNGNLLKLANIRRWNIISWQIALAWSDRWSKIIIFLILIGVRWFGGHWVRWMFVFFVGVVEAPCANEMWWFLFLLFFTLAVFFYSETAHGSRHGCFLNKELDSNQVELPLPFEILHVKVKLGSNPLRSCSFDQRRYKESWIQETFDQNT